MSYWENGRWGNVKLEKIWSFLPIQLLFCYLFFSFFIQVWGKEKFCFVIFSLVFYSGVVGRKVLFCYLFFSFLLRCGGKKSKLISGRRRHWYLDAQLFSTISPLQCCYFHPFCYFHPQYYDPQCCSLRNPFVGTIFIRSCLHKKWKFSLRGFVVIHENDLDEKTWYSVTFLVAGLFVFSTW